MIGLRRNGWIGIDVGTSTVKVVQMARVHGRLQLTRSAIVSRHAAWPANMVSDTEPHSSADGMRVAISLNSGFSGRRAAAVLPMTLCHAQTVGQALEYEPEPERLVRPALEVTTQRSAEDLKYDFWDAEAEEGGQRPSRSNVLSVPRTWSDQLCSDMVRVGWSCQTLDGLPLALARAVDMVQPDTNVTPVSVLDWGFGRTTFCVVKGGRPVYVRGFKDCGFHHTLQGLSENLGVSSEEAVRLLHDYGMAGGSNEASMEVGEVIKDLIAEPLTRLEEQYRRTISHLQGQRRKIVPKRMYLFGGGATIKGLATHLTTRLQTNVQVWQFQGTQTDPGPQGNLPSCLLGPAVALSALAWEQR